ncbi:MAG: SET domain-containing protein [Acidobacteria bacterium]|nr:SET domain-containing protein [Acidobacteriota bacterium]MCA1640346.1 SET domain-containing protein [Acidobacteriota bacterium]
MTRWKPRYAIKRTAIGLGFFTLNPIPADKRIIEYIGLILTKEEADKKGGKYLMTIDEEYLIDGSPRSNIARYINHSCRPNAKAYRSGVRMWIWSIKVIKAGEEITIDYGKNYFDDFIKPIGCKCAKCVKKSNK